MQATATTEARGSIRREGRSPRRRSAATGRVAAISALLVAAQLVWPLVAVAHGVGADPAASADRVPTGHQVAGKGVWSGASRALYPGRPALVPLGPAELSSVTGGCWRACSGGGSSSSSPSKTGSPYWEFAYRSLISRPAIAGDLIWHRVNDTDRYWGPFDVTYRYKETFNWSLGGSVPQSFVQGHIGGAYETSKTLVERFTIPPRTYYKFYVAYPYERWRYYYRKYQDYDDNTRDVVANGDATVYDQWTKSTLVQGRVY
jgi:hypothetical protein